MKRVYEHIAGNCEKKDLELQKVVIRQFGSKRLSELLLMVQDRKINVANAKIVMMKTIDGDRRMPSKIAEELGFSGTELD